jgi:nitroimidazol reductase NimA-like FMN-containing flavoprotein (pyridoxamine 5'-phosphate oxidase superfamily)
MGLARSEREQFLAEPHVAALAVAAGPDRAPVTVPVWYQYTPGEQAWILTPAASRKAGLIEAAGRFSLMAERVQPTVRYVSVEGPVVRTEPATSERHVELASRYLPGERARAYVEFAEAEFGEQVVIVMQPERWLSADLGAWT